jgi:hypothetical protein
VTYAKRVSRGDRPSHRRIAGILDRDGFAGIEQHLAHEMERGARPLEDEHVPRAERDTARLPQMPGELAVKRHVRGAVGEERH